MSKNAPTIKQLELACRHVNELMAAGLTENMAIRNLELFANVYAKFLTLNTTTPDHVSQYGRNTVQARNRAPGAKTI